MEDMDMNMPMCSVCETEIEYTEFTYDDCDGDVVYFKSRGRCPKCGREYRWYDKYNFAGVTEPKCVGGREE